MSIIRFFSDSYDPREGHGECVEKILDDFPRRDERAQRCWVVNTLADEIGELVFVTACSIGEGEIVETLLPSVGYFALEKGFAEAVIREDLDMMRVIAVALPPNSPVRRMAVFSAFAGDPYVLDELIKAANLNEEDTLWCVARAKVDGMEGPARSLNEWRIKNHPRSPNEDADLCRVRLKKGPPDMYSLLRTFPRAGESRGRWVQTMVASDVVDKVFLEACLCGAAEAVGLLRGETSEDLVEEGFLEASWRGHIDVMRILGEELPPDSDVAKVVINSASIDDTGLDTVERVLEFTRPSKEVIKDCAYLARSYKSPNIVKALENWLDAERPVRHR